MTHGWREHRVHRPSERAHERQRIGQRVGGDMLHGRMPVEPGITADRQHHAGSGHDRARQHLDDRVLAMGYARRQQHHHRGPQIVDQAHFHRGCVGRGQTQREGYRRFVKYEQQAADNQVFLGELANRGRAPEHQQRDAADRVDQGRAKRGAEVFGDDAHGAGHEAPQQDCHQADGRGARGYDVAAGMACRRCRCAACVLCAVRHMSASLASFRSHSTHRMCTAAERHATGARTGWGSVIETAKCRVG